MTDSGGDMTNIEISDITRLSVKPGEVLLVRVPRLPTSEEAHQINSIFKEALPGVKVLIAPEGLSVEAVAQDDS